MSCTPNERTALANLPVGHVLWVRGKHAVYLIQMIHEGRPARTVGDTLLPASPRFFIVTCTTCMTCLGIMVEGPFDHIANHQQSAHGILQIGFHDRDFFQLETSPP